MKDFIIIMIILILFIRDIRNVRDKYDGSIYDKVLLIIDAIVIMAAGIRLVCSQVLIFINITN